MTAVAVAIYSGVELARFEREEARRATLVYAEGQRLVPGVSVRAVDLAAILGRLGYSEVRGGVTAPGQYRRGAASWEIFSRSEGEGAHRIRLELNGDRIARVLRDDRAAGSAELEGEILASAGDRPGEESRPVRLADVPLSVVQAVVAAEDHRFFEHRGLDLRGVMRAAWANARAGRVTQGGSTITQQLVKNRLLSSRRTMFRKVREAWLATLVDWRYPKERILEAYLSELYLGQHGPFAIRGLGAAARVYFGKEVHQLTLAEGALLAGMARAPNSYSPVLHPQRARARRNVVLGQMRGLGMIGDADYRAAVAQPIRVRFSALGGQTAPYFMDHVRQELEERIGDEATEAGSKIFTTLDLSLQRFAEAAVTRGLDRLETSRPRLRRSEPGARLQAALVALDPSTGQIKAMVGGREYRQSQFNRAVSGRRQPGSAFKPFVFAAALATHGNRPAVTAATLVDDAPITLTVGGTPWSPRNYQDRYEGRVSVRRALEASLNAATVRIAAIVGLAAVIETARTLGLETELSPVPAMALGAFEVTPLELAHAYLPFANTGLRTPAPAAVRAAAAGDGSPVTLHEEESQRVLSPAESYLMTSLLQGVMTSGTGAASRALGLERPLAGKTGTTNEGRDAWFVGYSPTLLAVVWVGFDDAAPHGLSGAEAALPIWTDFMKQALDLYPGTPFTPPPGIVFADVDPTNGKLANRFCPMSVRETFLAGTEPEPCTDHGGVGEKVLDWWNRFRDWLRR